MLYESAEIDKVVPTEKNPLNSEGDLTNGIFNLDKNKLGKNNPNSPLLKISADLLIKTFLVEEGCHLKEFEIGAKLSHRNLARSYGFFVNEKNKPVIVMEKINGESLTNRCRGIQKKLENENVEKIIQSLKDVCLYLFDEKICWGDLNPGNLMTDRTSGDLKIVDFGRWYKHENDIERAFLLLTGSMEAVGVVLKSSELRNNEDRNFVYEFIFPKDFFGKSVEFTSIRSGAGSMHDESEDFKPCFKKISSQKGPNEIKKYLSSYFDVVLKKLEQNWEKK